MKSERKQASLVFKERLKKWSRKINGWSFGVIAEKVLSTICEEKIKGKGKGKEGEQKNSLAGKT